MFLDFTFHKNWLLLSISISDVRSGFAAMKASSSDASKGRAGLWSGK